MTVFRFASAFGQSEMALRSQCEKRKDVIGFAALWNARNSLEGSERAEPRYAFRNA